MPTHFSKLEGSPSHRQRQREWNRLRKRAATTTSTAPTFGFDKTVSISSNATAYEGSSIYAGSSLRRNISRDIPHYIRVQNRRCLVQQTQQQHQKQQLHLLQQHSSNRRQDRCTQQQQQQQQQRRQREHGISDRSSRVHNNNETSDQIHPHRPPRYNAYCESRVSAISSFQSHVEPGGSSSRVSSLSSSPRSDGRATNVFFEEFAPRGGRPPSRRRDGFGSNQEHTMKRPNDDRHRHKIEPNHNYVVYDLSQSAPSDTSTLTASILGGRSPQAVHTLVNSHGVFGGRSSNNTNNNKQIHENRRDSLANEPPSSSRRNHHSRSDPSPRRRKDDDIVIHLDDEDPFESREEASLWGERFADAYSESEHPPKDVLGSQHFQPNRSVNYSLEAAASNGNENGRNDNYRQQHHVPTKWLCDVCKEARFDTYVEAYRHEVQCRTFKNKTLGGSNTKETKTSHHWGDVEAKLESSSNNRTHNNSNNNHNSSNEERSWMREHKGNKLQEMSLLSSDDSRSSNHCRIATALNTPIALERDGNNIPMESKDEATRWLCSVCKEVSFYHYPDACYHEKICKIRMEATADLRGASVEKPMGASKPIPLLNLTRDDSVCMVRTDVTAAMRKAEDKLKSSSNPPSPLYQTQNLEDEKWYNDVALDRPERRQEENDREGTQPQVQYDTLDTIEIGRDRPMDTSITETRDDRLHTFDTNAQNDDEVFPRHSLFSSVSTRNYKGEAYDRYVTLASQQEEEEERERFIALAKQTREEELLSYNRGDKDDERYVCLA